jgi:predicted RNase H-like nuclease
MPDGVCFARLARGRARILGYAYPRGDAALLDALAERIPRSAPALLTIDAPIVCPNRTGTRPVDRLTHRLFHREHAGCHPANLGKCPRPARVLRRLRSQGFVAGWEHAGQARLAAEVYPHPAMVRLLRLPRIVKYKRGPVAERRREFARLQRLLRRLLAAELSFVAIDEETAALLRAEWSKPVEDRVDAFFCALLALWHLRHRGRRSQTIGDLATGFILLPEDLRRRPPVHGAAS